MQRSREEYAQAYDQFVQVSGKYRAVLEEWDIERAKGRLRFNDDLLKGFKHKEIESKKKVNKIVEAKIKEFQELGKVTAF